MEKLQAKLGNSSVRNGWTSEISFEISEKTRTRLAAESEQEKLKIEQEGERIRKKYGDISDREILKVLKIEDSIAECQNCKGLPCKKKEFESPLYTPEIIFFNGKISSIKNLCQYEKMRRLEKKYGLAKIPKEYQGKTFSDYKVDALNKYAVEVAKKLIEKKDKGAYFYGNVGTGKTLLVAIMAQEIIRRGREVIFCTVPTISMQLRSTFKGNSSITENEILEKLYKVPTLILDDVGMEKPTRFICSTLSNIFNERYNNGLQTIMTSNYRLKTLEEIYNFPSDGGETVDGTRIYDRCKQICIPVELAGNSRRC